METKNLSEASSLWPLGNRQGEDASLTILDFVIAWSEKRIRSESTKTAMSVATTVKRYINSFASGTAAVLAIYVFIVLANIFSGFVLLSRRYGCNRLLSLAAGLYAIIGGWANSAHGRPPAEIRETDALARSRLGSPMAVSQGAFLRELAKFGDGFHELGVFKIDLRASGRS